MSDIVERLRGRMEWWKGDCEDLRAASNEILRLRAENEKLREQNNRIAKMYEALEWDYKVALSNKETNTK